MSDKFYKYGTLTLGVVLIFGFSFFFVPKIFNLLIGVVILAAVLGFYFLPALNAHSNRHHNKSAIFVLNLLLGWTFLGWVVALVWSFTKK